MGGECATWVYSDTNHITINDARAAFHAKD
jgi:hypothetical protein